MKVFSYCFKFDLFCFYLCYFLVLFYFTCQFTNSSFLEAHCMYNLNTSHWAHWAWLPSNLQVCSEHWVDRISRPTLWCHGLNIWKMLINCQVTIFQVVAAYHCCLRSTTPFNSLTCPFRTTIRMTKEPSYRNLNFHLKDEEFIIGNK